MYFLESCFHASEVKVNLLLGGCLFIVCVWGEGSGVKERKNERENIRLIFFNFMF